MPGRHSQPAGRIKNANPELRLASLGSRPNIDAVAHSQPDVVSSRGRCKRAFTKGRVEAFQSWKQPARSRQEHLTLPTTIESLTITCSSFP